MEINKLLSHFKNGEYELVLKETSNNKDPQVLIMRAISFALTNQYQNAIDVLNLNKEILSKDLAKLIDVHMQICIWCNELIDAQKALEHYEEYPYVSQEVEEKFVFYRKDIEKRLKSISKSFHSEEDIIKLLQSNNPEKIQLAFSEIKKLEISPYVYEISKILISQISASTRCLGLILLFEKHYNHPVKYNWHGDIINVIPSKLSTPFQDSNFLKLSSRKDEEKDTAYASTYETLLATYYLYMYPKEVDEDLEDMHLALDLVTKRYIGWPQNKMRQSPNVERLIASIDKANSIF